MGYVDIWGRAFWTLQRKDPDKGACLVVARDIEDVNVARADEEKREEQGEFRDLMWVTDQQELAGHFKDVAFTWN